MAAISLVLAAIFAWGMIAARAAVFAVQTLLTEPLTFVAIIGILAFAIVLDLVWSRIRARRIAAG